MADQPNILIIWGDDIGHHQPELLQRRADGVPDPEHRPPRRRGCPVHGLLRRAELHRRPGGVHHRPEPVPDGADEGRLPRRRHRPARRGPDDRHRVEGPGLRHRAVRQEPLRRPRRVPADDARLRRVLREPLPPQRRGGAGGPRLPDRGGVPRLPGAVRPARRAPHLGQRRRDAAHREHRRADGGADEDLRRGVPRRRGRLHPPPTRRRHAVLRVVQHHPHALPHAHPRGGRRPRRPVAVHLPRHDGVPRRDRRPGARPARRAGHRRQHDRHVLDRQRSAHELVARRRA